jgi:hypothetical protein
MVTRSSLPVIVQRERTTQGDMLLCIVLLCTVNVSFLGAKSNYSFIRLPTADMSPSGTCHIMGTALSVADLLSICSALQMQEISCVCLLAGAAFSLLALHLTRRQVPC